MVIYEGVILNPKTSIEKLGYATGGSYIYHVEIIKI